MILYSLFTVFRVFTFNYVYLSLINCSLTVTVMKITMTMTKTQHQHTSHGDEPTSEISRASLSWQLNWCVKVFN